jgi:hypothetical protein
MPRCRPPTGAGPLALSHVRSVALCCRCPRACPSARRPGSREIGVRRVQQLSKGAAAVARFSIQHSTSARRSAVTWRSGFWVQYSTGRPCAAARAAGLAGPCAVWISAHQAFGGALQHCPVGCGLTSRRPLQPLLLLSSLLQRRSSPPLGMAPVTCQLNSRVLGSTCGSHRLPSQPTQLLVQNASAWWWQPS